MFNFDKQFFEKHQSGLLFIANKWYLRWLLGLNRLPKELEGKRIDKITPNSVHHVLETRLTKRGKFKNQKIKAAFFVGPRFAEALAYNLTPFVYLNNIRQAKMVWRFSPVGLVGALLLLLIPKASFFGFFGTVETYYDGTGDGNVRYDTSSTTWATATSASTGHYYSYTVNGDALVASYWNSSNQRAQIYRTFIPVNTSGLPDNASISAASLLIYAFGTIADGDNDANAYTVVVSASQASPTSLALTDYGSVGSTALSDTKDTTNISTSAYTEYVLNSTGISTISKTDWTKLSIREGHDFNNDAPTSGTDNGFSMYTAENTGTSKDPYLSITYTASGSSGPINLKTVNGLAKASVKTINGLAIASAKTYNGLT